MRADPAPRLSPEEAAPLLHALVHDVAAHRGLRALGIKGPVATGQGLRVPRRHGDIDVLVHPDDLRDLVLALEDAGWRRGLVSSAPAIMPPHSVDLVHERWPVFLDLHHYFPGLLAPADVAFDALWARRGQIGLAGVDVACPDPVAHTAILALNYLRDPRTAGSGSRQLRELRACASHAVGPRLAPELAALAPQLGAEVSLAPFLRWLGHADRRTVPHHESVPAVGRETIEAWRLRSGTPASYPWLHLLGRTPMRRWPRVLWRAVMLTEAELRTFHSAPASRGALLRTRWHRLRRAMRQLPAALTAFVRESRRTAHGRVTVETSGEAVARAWPSTTRRPGPPRER